MREFAGYLPSIGEEKIETKILTFQGSDGLVEVEVPLLTIPQMNKVADRVKQASSEVLKNFTTTEIVDIIDAAIERLLNRQSPYRKRAEQLLPAVTGYDAEMIRLGLTSFLKTFRKPQLQRFLVEDFGNPLLLDDFQPRPKGGFSKAVGPPLVVHVWAGNVPALPLWSLISGLLVKAGNIGKVSSAEPLFAGWFAQVLVEVEPRLADCLAVVWWKGGDAERESSLFRQAEVVVGYGSNPSLGALSKQVPVTTRFLSFGHKMSFGWVSHSCLDPRKSWEVAHQAAIDIMRFDQQGCYSPHLFYVQKGGKISPREFSRYLANELAALEKRYPRRKLTLEEMTSIASWRQQEELSLLSDPDKELLSGDSGNWAVVYEENGVFSPSCLNRVVKVVAMDQIEDLIPLISPYRSFLQTAGVAASPKELFHAAHVLGQAGVTRITSLGKMTSPEAGWHHDGRFNLADLVQMVDIERTAEDEAESFAPYID